jgi:N-dimethylarginine dimethylaminohydrolase
MTNPKRMLVCPPTYYTVEDEDNAHQHPDTPEGIPNYDLSQTQWLKNNKTIESTEVELISMQPISGCRDNVFTQNGGFIFENTIWLSHFRFKKRRRELPGYAKIFKKLGYNVRYSKDLLKEKEFETEFFEGHGDALYWNNKLIIGYGFRTTLLPAFLIGRNAYGYITYYIELVNKHFYHLDTCFCPMWEHSMYYPKAFNQSSLPILQPQHGEYIEVSHADAMRFACNSIPIEVNEKRYLVINQPSNTLAKRIESLGITILPVDVSEFLKSGGGPRCMVLFLP